MWQICGESGGKFHSRHTRTHIRGVLPNQTCKRAVFKKNSASCQWTRAKQHPLYVSAGCGGATPSLQAPTQIHTFRETSRFETCVVRVFRPSLRSQPPPPPEPKPRPPRGRRAGFPLGSVTRQGSKQGRNPESRGIQWPVCEIRLHA